MWVKYGVLGFVINVNSAMVRLKKDSVLKECQIYIHKFFLIGNAS
jgi:hypothetical protein